jgi:hypothetical protein
LQGIIRLLSSQQELDHAMSVRIDSLEAEIGRLREKTQELEDRVGGHH